MSHRNRRCCIVLVIVLGGCSSGEGGKDAAVGAERGREVAVADRALEGNTVGRCEAQIAKGPVVGVKQAHSCAYLGIPFAKPPTGALRWQRPAEPDPWSSPLSATKHGFACPQTPNWDGTYPWGPTKEDCLTLNVWTPSPRPSSPAPVMVWINKPSGFMWGSSHSAWTDGTNLAEHTGTILVTFDFRLGALGFLAHPALGAESGNYGFWDQIAALKWVQQNIAAFGGDPKNVTINGGGTQGAQSVCIHLLSPPSQGLFHRAIMESGQCPAVIKAKTEHAQILTRAQAEAQGKLFAQKAGCDTATDVAACLRGKTESEILWAKVLPSSLFVPAEVVWGPIIDGQILTDQPANAVQAGKAVSKVPLLLGAGKDEGYAFEGYLKYMTDTAYVTKLQTDWGVSLGDQILKLYPLADYPPPAGSTYSAAAYAGKNLLTDALWVCPLRGTARAWSAAGAPTYLYHFTLPSSYGSTPPDPFRGTGSSGMKVLVFHTPQPTAIPPWDVWVFSPDEEALSWKIMEYWARFAKTGDPNGAGAVTWPKYDKTTDPHLELGKEVKAGSHLRQAQCDFWDSVMP